MSSKNDKISNNRLILKSDFKNQLWDLPNLELELPNVGWFDEPRRWYPINKQWAAIFTGHMWQLTEITAWKDAENEDYDGIQGILAFIVGMTPEEAQEILGGGGLTCEEIKACLAPQLTSIQNFVSYEYNTANNINFITYQDGTGGDVIINYNEWNQYVSQEGATPINVPNVCGNWYAAAVAAVDTLDDLAQDFFAQIETTSNGAELLNNYLGLLPGLGFVVDFAGGDDLLFLANTYLAVPAESYNAQFTTVTRQDIICELFCQFASEGQVTPDIVVNWLASKLPEGFDILTNIQSLGQGLATGNYDDITAVYYVWMGLIGANQLIGTLGMNARQMNYFRIQIELASQTENNDYQGFCNPCGQWSQTFDFRTGLPDFVNIRAGNLTADGVQAIEVPLATEWHQGTGTGSNGIAYAIDFVIDPAVIAAEDWTIWEFELELTLIGTNGISTRNRLKAYDDPNNAQGSGSADLTPQNNVPFSTGVTKLGGFELQNPRLTCNGNTGNCDFAVIRYYQVFDRTATPDPLTAGGTFHRMTMRGLGLNPFTNSGTCF